MVFESVQQLGVRTVPLAKFISQSSTGKKPYPGKIILARHDDYADKGGKSGSAAMQRLADFAVDRFGQPFAAIEILKIAARICIGSLHRKMPKMLGPEERVHLLGICRQVLRGGRDRNPVGRPRLHRARRLRS